MPDRTEEEIHARQWNHGKWHITKCRGLIEPKKYPMDTLCGITYDIVGLSKAKPTGLVEGPSLIVFSEVRMCTTCVNMFEAGEYS